MPSHDSRSCADDLTSVVKAASPGEILDENEQKPKDITQVLEETMKMFKKIKKELQETNVILARLESADKLRVALDRPFRRR
jgi:hypothetical protein